MGRGTVEGCAGIRRYGNSTAGWWRESTVIDPVRYPCEPFAFTALDDCVDHYSG